MTTGSNESASELADQDLSTCIPGGRHRVDMVFTYTGWQTRGIHNFTIVGAGIPCNITDGMLAYSSHGDWSKCTEKTHCYLRNERTIQNKQACTFTCHQTRPGDFYVGVTILEAYSVTLCGIAIE